MSENRSNPPAKVTIEDLLRFKRCERPAPEFWTEFECALRQKQLAALVVRKPWWHGLALINRRLGLPLGAVALLGLAYLALHQRAGHSVAVSTTLHKAPVRHVGVPAARKSLVAIAQTAKPAPAVTPSHVHTSARQAQPALAKYETLVAEGATGMRVQPAKPALWLGEILASPINATPLSQSARPIPVDYAGLTAEPELVDPVVRPLGFESRPIPSVHPPHAAEILPTAVAVTESRRTRMLASLDSSDNYAAERLAPDRTRRSVLRYLSQEGWDHSMGRLEAEGDKLSIRF